MEGFFAIDDDVGLSTRLLRGDATFGRHLPKAVELGGRVKRGDRIGVAGETGSAPASP